jgi:hypothetical protein
MQFDSENHLWVSNRDCFLRLNTQDFKYSIYSQSNGLIANRATHNFKIINQNQLATSKKQLI